MVTANNALESAIARIREEYLDDPRFNSVRLDAEARARDMLDANIGAMTPGEIRSFLDCMNTENIRGKTSLTRFGRHFTNIIAVNICKCPREFNEWIGILWKTQDKALQNALARIFKIKPIMGAGTVLPTFIMYLRAPDASNIYTTKLAENLAEALSNDQLFGGSPYERYELFNRAVLDHVVKPFKLQPQEVDLVLSQLPNVLPKSSSTRQGGAGGHIKTNIVLTAELAVVA